MAFFSNNSADYGSAIKSLKKPTYESKYDNLINQQMQKILNRENFSYDFNADPLYQNYKDQYTKLGKEASMNAAAAASALTGGYGNSYSGTAASQANQQYLTQLNNKIPELYDAAMKKYNMETENLYNQFGALQTEEGRQYGMYRDSVSDYYSDLSDLRNGYGTALGQENANRDFDYKVSRDAVSDSQWEKNFAYQQARDAVADSQWEKEYQLALQKARKAASGGGRSSGGSTTTAKNNIVNSEGMTTRDANLHLTTMAGMSEKDAEAYARQLKKNGKISEADANYLWQEYLKLPNANTSLNLMKNVSNFRKG